jgi:predicted DNA-binding protein (MmcQ/YjbR family)
MRVDSIRVFCLSLPHATEKLQWGDNLCFKARDKIFAILGLDELRLCFKCTSEVFSELIEREHMRPAPYLGRYKWILLERLDALSEDELKDLIRDSHGMVVAKAARKKGERSATPRTKKKSRLNRKR